MTSFIDLMGNDAWSEADIVNRTEAMLHGVFSKDEEIILNRKVTGAVLGQYAMTPAEQQDMARYAQAAALSGSSAAAARLDMVLLREVMSLEHAHKRISQTPLEAVMGPSKEPMPDPDPAADPAVAPAPRPLVVTNQPELDADQAQRAEAQGVVSLASAAANALYLVRNPAVT